jgi:thymidine kinase
MRNLKLIKNENPDIKKIINRQNHINDVLISRIDELASFHNELVTIVQHISDDLTHQLDVQLNTLGHVQCQFSV